MRLLEQMDTEKSPLRDVVGRKLMLEYDIGSVRGGEGSFPGIFLRPGERPIIGTGGQAGGCCYGSGCSRFGVGWKANDAERENVGRVYLAQPGDTRLDSFGVFPSRARANPLGGHGFRSQQEICTYLENIGWPGQLSAVESVITRFRKRADIVRTGANLDVREEGVGPTLGLTLIVKQRYTKDFALLARWADRLGPVPGSPGS